MPETVTVAGGQGFYGDTPAAVDELLAEGVDYLCLEALAELTLAILQKDRQRDEARGYTRDLPAYLAQMAPLDPVRHVGQVGVPVFFQFAKQDRFVPPEKAQEFVAGAREPKSAGYYDAGHALSTKDGVAERFLWLQRQLKLGR